MRLKQITNLMPWALVVAVGCQAQPDLLSDADDDTGDDTSSDEAEGDGVYRYALGHDPVSGTPIYGGSHSIVTFDGDGKAEAINLSNRAARLHPELVVGSMPHAFDAAITAGESTWPVFPSTWWPQSKNGTAWRWQPGSNQDYNDRGDLDRLSPLEKYDLMFYPGQEQVVPAVSHCTYQDSVEDPQNCTKIDRPQIEVVGPATRWELEHQGNYNPSYEPEGWWGHCNGWASYATTEPLGFPQRDIRVRLDDAGQVQECRSGVTEGCVLWRMADIEALMTELYFTDQSTFSGSRCNTRPDEIERDEHGRPTDSRCRDLNAGSFHVAVTHLLGRGARHLGSSEEGGRPAFVIDHNYDYEVWNFPVVRFELIEQEDVTEQAAHELVGATGIDYAFNVQATAFKRVRLAYFMVSDGVPAHQLFTRADQRNISLSRHELNYVLELDASGQVLGGEWIAHPTFTWNDSKSLHPDFMWMGTSHRGAGESDDDLGGSGDNPYVAYSKARALLLCANDPQTCAPPDEPNDDVLVEERGQLAQGQTVRFATDPLPAGRYTVTLTEDAAAPGGDVDLYVRAGAEPTMSVWDCRPYRYGSNETCTIELQSEGAIHVLLYGYNSGTNPFVLRVTGEGGDGPDPDVWPGMSESGTVASGEEHRFATGVVAAGSYRFQITGTADADVYVRAGSQPTTQAFDCRPYTGNSNETCRVDLTAPAEIHVMVRGYATTSDYQLVGTRE